MAVNHLFDGLFRGREGDPRTLLRLPGGECWTYAEMVDASARLANLLIDTEQEMKKVTWPSFDDSKKSSLVVIGCVVFMLGFLTAADLLLSTVFKDLIYR